MCVSGYNHFIEEIFTCICVFKVCVISILFLNKPNKSTVNSWKEGTWESNIKINWFQFKSVESVVQARYIDHLEKNLKI